MMQKFVPAALLAALLLAGCNGMTMSGPSGTAGPSEQSMASGSVGDVGLGSGGFAASGLAGGEIGGGGHGGR